MITLLITASAITLTRFVRSERYAIATGGQVQSHGQSAGEGRSGGVLWPIKMLARLVTQYPASLPLFALTSTLDTFLYAYAVLHLLYVGQSGLGIILKLGRFAPKKAQITWALRSQDESNYHCCRYGTAFATLIQAIDPSAWSKSMAVA